MSGLSTHTGKAVALNRVNVDTDQIIPKNFLKRIEKTGFGRFLFNENFGCGSSREHAPWALLDYGFKVVIAPSFADIFYQNCLKNGMVPIKLDQEKVEYLLDAATKQPYELTVNVEEATVSDDKGFKASFPLSDYWKKMIVNGWDEIEITLQLDEQIAKYEEAHPVLK